MLLNSTQTPYRRSLEDHLVLRTAADKQDIERVAAFNGTIHGPLVASMTRNLFTHHPHTRAEDLIFVEDEQSGQIVSSLCLIPWIWRYEDVDIPAGEMGIVGTLEAYRRRGLIRAQVKLFKRRLRERGCLLSQIQGIPYYYRQFGYEYALPLEGGLRLETCHVPDPPDTPFTFRRATPDDLSALMKCYDEAAQDLAIQATWRYLLTHADGTEMERDTWIVQDADGQVAGYLCVPRHHFGEELVVSEVSRLGFDVALVALNHLKALTLEREKPGIRLNLPAHCTLMRLARAGRSRPGHVRLADPHPRRRRAPARADACAGTPGRRVAVCRVDPRRAAESLPRGHPAALREGQAGRGRQPKPCRTGRYPLSPVAIHPTDHGTPDVGRVGRRPP
jgi:predicted N-acetyltransferase YhbS